MKLYGLLVYNANHQLVYDNYNLGDVFFMFRSKIQEGIKNFASKLITIAEKDNYYQINENRGDVEMSVHFFKYHIAITSPDYPQHVVYQLFNTLISNKFDKATADNLFTAYQDPVKMSQILKTKKEIDETKVILLDSVEKLLERGEKIEHLVDRTEELVRLSEQFRIKAEDLNSCCVLF
jgi:synaptobrevin family protein YKT6